MARDQYQHNRTPTQIQWNGYHCGYSGQVYKDDLVKDNDDLQKEQPRSIGMKYGNFMELQGKFLVTENHNLCQSS